MQLSTKSRYALRMLAELAIHGQQGPVTRAQLAVAQDISPDYMAQLFRQLQAAGLVHSVKGPGGGYELARDAAEITAGDIVRAVEGPIALAPCDECNSLCTRVEGCIARLVWQDAAEALARRLDAWSLRDMARSAQAPAEHQDEPALEE